MLDLTSDSKSLRTILSSPPCGRRIRTARSEPYAEGGVEPRLEDLLADPVTEAMMRGDGVNPAALRELISHTQQILRGRSAA